MFGAEQLALNRNTRPKSCRGHAGLTAVRGLLSLYRVFSSEIKPFRDGHCTQGTYLRSKHLAG